ncbi:MAG: DUF507 family protein [Thermodesulfobacteriota bacterium]
MRLSDERISHIAHLVTDAIWNDDLVDYSDDAKALAEAKRVITEIFRVEDVADDAAREKIRSLSRDIPEGCREWEILYKKYFDEEINKKRGSAS